MKIWIFCGIAGLILLLMCKNPLRTVLRLIANCISGLIAILAVNTFIPVFAVGYNCFNIAISAVFGVPGAALLCILNKII